MFTLRNFNPPPFSEETGGKVTEGLIKNASTSMEIARALKRGVYCLVVQLHQRSCLEIGRLGTFDFPAGFYVYVGSAQNNLERRIERHLRQEKKRRWHIDYLLHYGEVISVHTYAGERYMECVLSHKIGTMKDALSPVKGFGSSDCSCYSHLYFFQNNPRLRISVLKTKWPLKAQL